MTRALLILLLTVSSVLAQPGWKLIWSDEFTGPANTKPDPTKWDYDLGAGGWGNNELEKYMNTVENAHLDGSGNLVIRAMGSAASGYTSARIKTQGRYSATYGRVEARIKIPFGQGIWPAFWMLGNDITTAGWPACGEIDVMENIGREPAIVHGTVHGPGYSGGNGISAAYPLAKGRFADDFHVYSMEWGPSSIEFFVDSVSYKKVTPASLPSGAKWVFDHPFFIILNMAVGGGWPGNPDATTSLPQDMTVDYVRVYQAAPGPQISLNGIVNAASSQTGLAPGSLGTLFGSGLAAGTNANLFDPVVGAFPREAGLTKVTVNSVDAPLVFVSPDQINFQIPWETPVGRPVPIEVSNDGVVSESATFTMTDSAASAYLSDGIAILSCMDNACTLWGNGFGLKTVAQRNGAPSEPDPLPWAQATCRLMIGATEAAVSYCGAAPGLIVDQLNFVFPPGLNGAAGSIAATLRVGTSSIDLRLPLTH